jgi:hypothetical protein
MAKTKRTKGQEEFEDTKGVIRICKLKNRQHNDQKDKEEFEDTKGVIRIYKLKNRQHNGQKRDKGQTKIYKALHI